MTTEALRSALELLEKATPGEFSVSGTGFLRSGDTKHLIGDGVYGPDAAAIAALVNWARTHGPALLSALSEGEKDADGWIAWNGGDCPVPDETVVDVRLRADGEVLAHPARYWNWQHDDSCDPILAYRVAATGDTP